MKRLTTTTALALILAGTALAQTVETQQEGAQTEQTDPQLGNAERTGGMQTSDLLASELMDAQIFAPAQGQNDGPQDQASPQGLEDRPGLDDQQEMGEESHQHRLQAQSEQHDQQGQRTSRWGEPTDIDQLQGMEHIGNVSDLLIDEQGNIQALLVDVGGFLGIGTHQIALGLDEVNFSADSTDPTRIYVIASMDADLLEAAPEFEASEQQNRGYQQDGTAQETMQQQGDWRGGRDGLMAPEIQREGYQQAQVNEISTDDLLDANLYDVNDDNVGNVADVVIGAEGEAQYIVADVGGFLGLGAHTVAIGFDEVSVLRSEGITTGLRIYVDVTEDTLRSMPEYNAN